jgi:hypothetical protein
MPAALPSAWRIALGTAIRQALGSAADRRPEGDPHVLDRVVEVHREVALRPQPQVE